ncbi:hypothetical protein HQ325_03605 [Rhodococcus sp. BP-349]|uniref:hypothetical protein n=1 Tax=unclassified Rhodococcus (in: high G+C Gram-positive bacteria) TaxID=192944 RepID=UPI001C9ADEEC|nr:MULTISPECIES: hypothetical protein [unclassified Rhodococcus (in: high G+C Gram-positive bacteria)]MBY6537750.1 hypothetical protein [Rhodococcus sp. BP-363]MBY6542087.1 hypothetical protein [Rhodococcus sp. BP-369]MBY6561317.1 hypothetical protein [Rhodococcus sp. BP-370]MBY6575609.1 hypothetical protein [Rhodococcus sp. BP-364]MBY6584910.1 hypothetical protein [Rhodococcus sp. BP-358]
MRDWIIRLTAIDDDAASALRVIEHFDTLVDERVPATALLRAVTVLADCGAGFHDPDRGLPIEVDEHGRTSSTPDVSTRPHLEQFGSITVWLNRTGPPWPLDHLILERFARSLQSVEQPRERHPVVAAIRTVCDADASPAHRSAALATLGLTGPIVIAATLPRDSRRTPIGMTADGARVHLLSSRPTLAGVPTDAAAGYTITDGLLVCTRWQRAVSALKIAVDPATGGPAHVCHDDLGAVADLIDNIDATTASRSADVQVLESLRLQRQWVTGLLDSILSHSSVREAARRQNLHHSTLQQRLDWLQSRLGYTVLSPTGHARASTTLLLWRISRAAQNRTTPAVDPLPERRPPRGG